MSEELKPCPFCGSKDILESGYQVNWITCLNCECDGPLEKTKQEAIKAWNKRVKEAPPEESE